MRRNFRSCAKVFAERTFATFINLSSIYDMTGNLLINLVIILSLFLNISRGRTPLKIFDSEFARLRLNLVIISKLNRLLLVLQFRVINALKKRQSTNIFVGCHEPENSDNSSSSLK